MSGHDFYDRPYTETCECGKTVTVKTQEADRPEYYTTVSVVCDCGKEVIFSLPVN